MAVWLALVVMIASGFVLVGSHDAILIGGMDAADLAMTASGVLLTACIAAAMLPQVRESHPRGYRLIARGGGVLAVLFLGVWLRGPLQEGAWSAWDKWGYALPVPRVLGDTIAQWRRAVLPAATLSAGEKAVRIRRRADGHFYASVALNGTPASLLVDSGATTVMLKASDARDAGIDISTLSFNTPIETASGAAYVARVRLRQLRVGIIVVDDVEAVVAQPGRLETSLLGMNFLSRLRSYEFSGASLTFRG